MWDFKFSDKIPGFSKTIELCPNFWMGFCMTWYYQIITKGVHKKKQFYFNHASHLSSKKLISKTLKTLKSHEENKTLLWWLSKQINHVKPPYAMTYLEPLQISEKEFEMSIKLLVILFIILFEFFLFVIFFCFKFL